MYEEIAVGVISGVASCTITIVVDECRFKKRGREALISKIVDTYIQLRHGDRMAGSDELGHFRDSGILLLKKEKDAEVVLERIKGLGFSVSIPKFIEKHGILKGFQKAIDEKIDLKDDREVGIKQIREAMESGDSTF